MYDCKEEGPVHDRLFTIRCFTEVNIKISHQSLLSQLIVQDERQQRYSETGSAKSKKLAKRLAADKLLQRIKDISVQKIGIDHHESFSQKSSQEVIRDLSEMTIDVAHHRPSSQKSRLSQVASPGDSSLNNMTVGAGSEQLERMRKLAKRQTTNKMIERIRDLSDPDTDIGHHSTSSSVKSVEADGRPMNNNTVVKRTEKKEQEQRLGCVCNRAKQLVLCQKCGSTFSGRLKGQCSLHPSAIFLLDISACAHCKAGLESLKEFQL